MPCPSCSTPRPFAAAAAERFTCESCGGPLWIADGRRSECMPEDLDPRGDVRLSTAEWFVAAAVLGLIGATVLAWGAW